MSEKILAGELRTSKAEIAKQMKEEALGQRRQGESDSQALLRFNRTPRGAELWQAHEVAPEDNSDAPKEFGEEGDSRSANRKLLDEELEDKAQRHFQAGEVHSVEAGAAKVLREDHDLARRIRLQDMTEQYDQVRRRR
jgi:hypothetical protein